MTVGRSVQIASAVLVLAAVMTGPADTRAAEEPTPATFVTLKFDGTCDENNNRLWLANTHTFKTIATTIRWRAAGGKNLTDQFFPAPNTVREIGCAAEGEILEAKFAEF
jgi:hypothetical protein